MIQQGTTINGRYRVLRVVGTGGMGAVYAAQDERLGRTVALKLLRADLASDRSARQRFLREAQIAAQLIHPNIVRTYDVGDAPEGPYLVQELLDGQTLDTQLPQPPAQAVTIARQVAEALGYIHDQGYVHCDIKPHNIMLLGDRAQPRVVLLDFGIARMAGTDTTTLIATPQYLAPERALGAAPTAASDLYALGIVLYQMLAGRPPFDAPTLHSIIEQHRVAPLPPLQPTEPLVGALEPIIQRLTAKQPDARPASAAVVAADLAAVQRSPQHSQPTMVVSRPAVAAPATVRPAPAIPPAAVRPASAVSPRPVASTNHKPIGLRYLWLPLLLGVLLLGAMALRARSAGPDADPDTRAIVTPPSAPAQLSPPPSVSVPNVLGLPIEQAQQQIEAAGLDFVVGPAVPNEQPVDTVVTTDPGPEQPLAPGAPVTVQISAGPPPAVAPPAPVVDDGGGGDDEDDDDDKKPGKGKGRGKDKDDD